MTLAAIALLLAPTAFAQDGGPTLTVETWNVGLAHGFVDHAAARLPAIVDAIEGADADVLCVQEAWEPGDRTALRLGAGPADQGRMEVIQIGR